MRRASVPRIVRIAKRTMHRGRSRLQEDQGGGPKAWSLLRRILQNAKEIRAQSRRSTGDGYQRSRIQTEASHGRRGCTGCDGRRFVGTMLGTEGRIICAHAKAADTTELVPVVEVADREWTAKSALVTGRGEPSRTGRDAGPGREAKFGRPPSGLRALRMLGEALPHLHGRRLKESQRAIGFFSPTGHMKGRAKAAENWGDLRT